jgi:hypothetical protein
VREETVKMLANLGTADIDFQEGDDIVDDVLDVPDLPADRKMLDLDLLHKVSHWDGVPGPVVPEVGARNARNDLPPYIPPSFHEYFAPQRLKVLSLLCISYASVIQTAVVACQDGKSPLHENVVLSISLHALYKSVLSLYNDVVVWIRSRKASVMATAEGETIEMFEPFGLDIHRFIYSGA